MSLRNVCWLYYPAPFVLLCVTHEQTWLCNNGIINSDRAEIDNVCYQESWFHYLCNMAQGTFINIAQNVYESEEHKQSLWYLFSCMYCTQSSAISSYTYSAVVICGNSDPVKRSTHSTQEVPCCRNDWDLLSRKRRDCPVRFNFVSYSKVI
jgi:hypothetical protein